MKIVSTLLLCFCCVDAFNINSPSSSLSSPSRTFILKSPQFQQPFHNTNNIKSLLPNHSNNNDNRFNLQMSTKGEEEGGEEESTTSSAPKRNRRKRKDGKNLKSVTGSNEELNTVQKKEEEEDTTTTTEEEIKATETITQPPPRSSKSVQLKVRDVRDIVSGVAPFEDEDEYIDDDEEEDDDEYEYYYEDEDNNEVIVSSGSKDNSLEALLADARRMRKEDEENGVESGLSIPSAVREVISTIVTIDFFVVCALFAWFLAGIFCSYIIKDDAVQIAFNGIFEPVVQPALGVLMIGAAGGAVFNDSEKEEGY